VIAEALSHRRCRIGGCRALVEPQDGAMEHFNRADRDLFNFSGRLILGCEFILDVVLLVMVTLVVTVVMAAITHGRK
jgi:hypothetical protein